MCYGEYYRSRHLLPRRAWEVGCHVGGYTHGETDDFSYNVVEDPVNVRDLHATMLHLLGVDHRKLTFPYQGLDQKLTGVEEARVVKEIIS